jgi:alpha-glucosidase (family GH31 glycosyl hydrolase)
VAPVVEKDATSRKVYLPAHRSPGEGGPRPSTSSGRPEPVEGRESWFDFWTEEKVDGGREIDRAVDLATMPLYVRAGAIVPMGPVKQYTSEPVDGPLTVTVYPGADGSFEMFEDDGKSFEYRRGGWMGISFQWTDRERRLAMSLMPGSRMRAPLVRDVVVRVAGQPATQSVKFSGRPVSLKL